VSTESCGEASRFGKLKAHDVILTALPAKSLRQDVRIRRKGAAGCLSASGAMTFYEFEEWQVCLKLNRSAKTSTAHDHVSISLFYRFSCGFSKSGNLRGSTKLLILARGCAPRSLLAGLPSIAA
jgi:hypothetical protein